MIVETAPAKINLYLHVGPVRADGLHELASLFVFAEDGDRVTVETAKKLSLKVTGPFASALRGLAPEDNLIWRAAALLQGEFGVSEGAAITLEKNLPVAAGIGGGSADAAAVLQALMRLWRLELSDAALSEAAFRLGADVPACLASAPVNVTGAGEYIAKGPIIPPLWICLANPGVQTPTGPIFQAFDRAHPAPSPPDVARLAVGGVGVFCAALEKARNDLQPFAVARAPVIADTLALLEAAAGARLARMSGSGATCFALFASHVGAERAARHARSRGWWAMASRLRVR